ncbi:metallophosphoesterase [Gorillibacterium sp. sgz5001074]|uniref:metallophosphoesterase n=1 Tax=Gorillibacterium sp. sgz5001074 TaxID=3446695 RepID=UPI003F66B1A1
MFLECIAIAATAASGYGLFVLPTQWLKVEHVIMSIGLKHRIVQISDLHVERLRVSPERLARIVRQEGPDSIMLTGDFTRKLRYLPRLEPYLKTIMSIGVPVYAVPGNHDYKMKSGVERLFRMLKQYGITVLRNESIEADGFRLVGIDNFGTGHSRIQDSFKKIEARNKTIVITHDPNVVPHIKQSYDYLMSGHLHGKQFNLPFLFKIKKKGDLPTRGIYKGLHKAPEGWFYISKGIGQAGINARLFVRSEITVHDL